MIQDKEQIIYFIEQSICSSIGTDSIDYTNKIHVNKIFEKILLISEFSKQQYYDTSSKSSNKIQHCFDFLHQTIEHFKEKIQPSDLIDFYYEHLKELPFFYPNQLELLQKLKPNFSEKRWQLLLSNQFAFGIGHCNYEDYYVNAKFQRMPLEKQNKINLFLAQNCKELFKTALLEHVDIFTLLSKIFNFYKQTQHYLVEPKSILALFKLKEKQEQFDYNQYKKDIDTNIATNKCNYRTQQYLSHLQTIFTTSYFSQEEKDEIYEILNVDTNVFFKDIQFMRYCINEENNLDKIKKYCEKISEFNTHISKEQIFCNYFIHKNKPDSIQILIYFAQQFHQNFEKAHLLLDFFLPHIKHMISVDKKNDSLTNIDFLFYNLEKKKNIKLQNKLKEIDFEIQKAQYEKYRLNNTIDKNQSRNTLKI